MAAATPTSLAGARMSHCSAPVPGLNHSSELLPVQLVGAWISSRAPSAVSTSLSPSVCGTLTSVIEPLRACLKICSTAQGPAACRYSPLGRDQASRSPRSPLLTLRTGVSACGRAPLTGTSQSCGLALFGGSQDARTVVVVHQRTGLQLSALAPGTGRERICAPSLLTSLRPWLAPVRNSVPDGWYSARPSAEVPSEWVNRPDRVYLARLVRLPDRRLPTMFRPSGVVNPTGLARPGMTNVLSCPVASVSTSTPPLPENTWNSARFPSGDQASSTGANRESGQRASWYLVPEGLIRARVSGPERPPSGWAVVSWTRTQPGPTRSHGTLGRAAGAAWAAWAAEAARAAGGAAATPAMAVNRTAVRIAVRGARRRCMPS